MMGEKGRLVPPLFLRNLATCGQEINSRKKYEVPTQMPAVQRALGKGVKLRCARVLTPLSLLEFCSGFAKKEVTSGSLFSS